MPDRFKTALWLVWTASAMFLTAGIVRWHVEYFRRPGPDVYRAALIALPLLALAALLWTRVRARFLWRYELAVIVAIPLAVVLLREPRAALVVAALFTACYCAGRALCVRCGWITGAPAADLVFSLASGFTLLEVALFSSGLARLWYPWFFALLLFVPIAVFHRNVAALAAALRAIFRRWGEFKELNQPLPGVLMPFTAILAASATALMLAPTLSWDAMKMHLPLAQYYLQVHGLEPKPQLNYSFFPQNVESLFALVWSLGGQPAAQLISPLFFLLMLLALWILARDCGADAAQALTGVVLAASLPVLHWAASVPKNDAALGFFLLASLLAALRWRDDVQYKDAQFKWAQAGILFLACAFATKDLAALGAASLGCIFLYAAWRQPRRVRAIASLAMIFAVVTLVWYMRRFILIGNPVFPLAAGRDMVANWSPDPSLRGTILRMLRLPWDLHFHGQQFSETVLIAPLGIALVCFWPLWLFARQRLQSAERLVIGFALFTFVLWGLVSPLVRYAATPLAVVALLTGMRLAGFWKTAAPAARASLALLSLWVLIPAVCAILIVENNLPQIRYLAGTISRDDYLNRTLISYPALAWLRDHTAPSERILGLENCSDVYAPEYPRYQSLCAFRPWNSGGIEQELREGSYRWLLAPAADQAALRATGRSAVEMYRDPTFAIYRLE